MNQPELDWDLASAYDFFISLRVLHDPVHYGLRPSWAAGVRSRLAPAERETLEQAQEIISWPVKWVHRLPAPKDAATVLWCLRQIPAEDRLLTLLAGTTAPGAAVDILREAAEHGAWSPADQESLRAAYQDWKTPPRLKSLATMLDLCARAAEFGDQILAALNSYQRVFFQEEENHIRPILEESTRAAQNLAKELPFDLLVENLSRGVRLGEVENESWVMAPSYWITPLVFFDRIEEGRGIFIFGGRPDTMSLVPGERIPEGLLRALKTLGDPTRLRILRYLAREAVTPAELARRLRLRPPTVTHHLNALRLAGLVYLTLAGKNEHRYAARLDAVDGLFSGLKDFLVEGSDQ